MLSDRNFFLKNIAVCLLTAMARMARQQYTKTTGSTKPKMGVTAPTESPVASEFHHLGVGGPTI